MQISLFRLSNYCLIVFLFLQTEISQAQNKVLVEKFSNVGCAPCMVYKPKFDSIVKASSDKITLLEYRTSWPSPKDPFYNLNVNDNRERVVYYEVTGIPMIQVNGKMYFTNEFTGELIDSLFKQKNQVTVTADFSLHTDTVTVQVKLNTQTELAGTYRLYATDVGGEYDNILRQNLVADGSELKLPDLKKDFEGNYIFNGVFINSKYFNAAKTKVICFLQNIETKEVVASCYASLK